MVLGAFVAALLTDCLDPLAAIEAAADQILPGSGTWLLLAALPALITVITVNIYAAALELITIGDSFVKVRPTRKLRIVACTIIALAGLLGAELSTGDFLASFGSFLVILLYVLVPWTSVNLVDYYFVRRGHYAVAQIFVPAGLYGNWGWRGLTAYAAGIVAMIPFVVTTWWVGPGGRLIGGIDIALFVGLAVSAIVYALLARSLDTSREIAVAREELNTAGIQSSPSRDDRTLRGRPDSPDPALRGREPAHRLPALTGSLAVTGFPRSGIPLAGRRDVGIPPCRPSAFSVSLSIGEDEAAADAVARRPLAGRERESA